MILDVLGHVGLELSGQGVWSCVRGKCQHRHHRFLGDAILMLALAVVTVHWLG